MGHHIPTTRPTWSFLCVKLPDSQLHLGYIVDTTEGLSEERIHPPCHVEIGRAVKYCYHCLFVCRSARSRTSLLEDKTLTPKRRRGCLSHNILDPSCDLDLSPPTSTISSGNQCSYSTLGFVGLSRGCKWCLHQLVSSAGLSKSVLLLFAQ